MFLSFEEHGVRGGFGASTAGERRALAIDGCAGTIRFTNRDAIVERHEEGVGIPVKKRGEVK